MANETLKFCDLGPALIGEEKYKELNATIGGVGGASDLGPAFLSAEPEPVKEEAPAEKPAPKAAPKPAAKKRAR